MTNIEKAMIVSVALFSVWFIGCCMGASEEFNDKMPYVNMCVMIAGTGILLGLVVAYLVV